MEVYSFFINFKNMLFNNSYDDIYNDYNVGSYLIFNGIKVFVDPRCDLYSQEINNVDILKDEFDMPIDDIMEKYNLKVCCPCDTEKSNFYKYFCDCGVKVDLYQDVFNVDYSKYDLVVTNPPFKIKKELLKFYLDNNINFILVLPDIMIYHLKHNELKLFKNQKPQLFINGRLNK